MLKSSTMAGCKIIIRPIYGEKSTDRGVPGEGKDH